PINLAIDAEVRAYSEMIYRTFFPPEHPGPSENDCETMARYLRRPGMTAFIARIGGETAGGAAVQVVGEVAALSGAGVRAEFRRRGVQQHLLAHRLNEAREAGARIATVGARPGADTERNV